MPIEHSAFGQDDCVNGRFSGSVLGEDVRLQTAEGKDVHLNASVPLEVMTLVDIVAFKVTVELNAASAGVGLFLGSR